MADGSVNIAVNMNVGKAQKKLDKLKEDIQKTQDDISETTEKRDKAKDAAVFQEKELENEKKALDEMQSDLKAMEEAKVAGDNLDKARKNAEKISKDLEATKENLSVAEDTSAIQAAQLDEEKQRLADMEMEQSSRKRGSPEYKDAAIDIKEQKERVNGLKKEWEKTDNSVQKYKSQIEETTAALNQANAEVSALEVNAPETHVSGDDIAAQKSAIKEQAANVKELETGLNRTNREIEKYNAHLDEANTKADKQVNEAAQLEQQIAGATDSTSRMPAAIEKAAASMDKFTNRVKKLASRVFVFTLITRALRSLRTWLSNTVMENEQAAQAVANLKGALLTLAQPLLNVIIPAFTTFINILTQMVGAIAKIVSTIFGTDLKTSANQAAKGLKKESDALGGVGSAAEDAEGSLAGFDEINTIQTEENTGGGGGSGGGEKSIATPDFSWVDGITDRLADIAKWVLLIGAGFALWKLGKSLPGMLGKIVTKLGLIIALVGAIALFWDGLKNAWQDGVGWGNMLEMIAGVAIAAFAAFKLFGTTFGPIAAGIILIVGGLAMLVTAFHDAMNGGWNLKNTLLAIAGILATGLGIGLIANSWIPVLIAAIAALLLAITVATGHGEEMIQGIRDIIQGFKDFFVGVFTGDIEQAIKGIEQIFLGFREFFGSIWSALQDIINGFLSWLDEKTGGRLHSIIETIRQMFSSTFSDIQSLFSRFWESIKQIFIGITTFISGVFSGNWDQAWDGIKQIFSGVWQSIVAIAKGGINLAIGAAENFINTIIGAINMILSGINAVGSIFGADWNLSLSPVSIPRLAEGAVIPPNREFMAVLGDQNSGNNIEAPESLIRQIVREESGGGNAEILREILSAIREGKVMMVDKQVLARITVKGINDMTAQSGKPVLLI